MTQNPKKKYMSTIKKVPIKEEPKIQKEKGKKNQEKR